jgi:branched-subunit amino acid aminotransferase/4-amino-4-deoxychorismate lyase
VTRPDPAAGVFETVRVQGGRAPHLGAHLARLAASARELYGVDVGAAAAARAAAALAGAGPEPQRLRVHAVPDGGAVRVEATRAPLGPAADPAPVALAPLRLPGGLGAHKWADRAALNRAAARLGATPLLVDDGEEVLEAAWGTVWVLEGLDLVTPPLDGRLLPGVTRARLLAAAPALGLRAREEPLGLGRLRAADEVLVTSALRGAVAAYPAGGPAARTSARVAAIRRGLLED